MPFQGDAGDEKWKGRGTKGVIGLEVDEERCV
jgi:hypothetical protein